MFANFACYSWGALLPRITANTTLRSVPGGGKSLPQSVHLKEIAQITCKRVCAT